MKLPAIAAALTLALSLPMVAQAAATATAHIAGFRYEVIDLDLNDGIAASLTLSDTGLILQAGYYPEAGGLPNPVDYRFSDGAVAVNVPVGSANGALANGVADLSATFTGTAADGQLVSHAGFGNAFTLTANTQVVLYADAGVTGNYDGDRYASSHALLFASYFADPNAAEETVVEDYLLSHLGNSDARELSITFSTGATSLEGQLGWSAGAYATVSQVPEPSQYALMLLGLAGVGWRLRRAALGR